MSLARRNASATTQTSNAATIAAKDFALPRYFGATFWTLEMIFHCASSHTNRRIARHEAFM